MKNQLGGKVICKEGWAKGIEESGEGLIIWSSCKNEERESWSLEQSIKLEVLNLYIS